MYRNNTTKTLLITPFNTITSTNVEAIINEIDDQPDEYFINNSEFSDFPEYLISKYKTEDFPIIHWKETQLEIVEKEIYASELPNNFDKDDYNAKVSINILLFHIPVDNDFNLLKYCSSNTFSTAVISGYPYVNDGNLIFSINDYSNNNQNAEREFTSSKNNFIKKLNLLESEVNQYNIQLPKLIDIEIKRRISKIQKMNEYKSKFSFPLKKKQNVPDVFKPHKVLTRKKIIPKPTIENKNTQEKYITNEDYEVILDLLQTCGKNWEHHPDTYKGRGEEALRDQLIFALAPNIEGVIAGEAYNKKGKTDISIKSGSTNLFIGECKIWTGSKGFHETIDQILGYLTWRDSKSAIMMFVPNKDISNVINTAASAVKEHPNFIREIKNYNPGWTNYKFHLDEDKNSYLTIAIQLYHLPELK